MPRPVYLAALLLLNLVPAFGVLHYGWTTFDLIFLYWLENLVIGAFMILRILVRRYEHPVMLVMPLFMVPFFSFHYGMFCYVHGIFVFELFGPESIKNMELLPAIPDVLRSNHLLIGVTALSLFHLFTWVNELVRFGPGADDIKSVTVRPYRRIIVLHITIIVGGFVITALGEPSAALLILIGLKIAFDYMEWRREEKHPPNEEPEVTDEMLAELAEEYPDPEIKVNGETIRYESFAELKKSKHYRLMRSLGGLVAGKHLKALDRYMDMRIAEEEAEKQQTD
jgi:hypothetical protein